jgi:hypothetical protein
MAVATGQITIVDLNDAVNLQGYLASTQPKIQFLDTAGTNYAPDWSVSYNTITAELYKMGEANNLITAAEVIDINWYKNGIKIISSGSGIVLNSDGVTGKYTSITINDNILTASDPAIKISCEIKYAPNASFISAPLIVKLDIDFGLTRQGSTGAAGAAAKTISLSGPQIFTYDASGTLEGPASSLIVVAKQNVTSTSYTWTYGLDGNAATEPLNAAAGEVVFGTDSVTIYPTASIWGAGGKALTIKAVSSEGASITDSFTLFKVQEAKGIDTTTITYQVGTSGVNAPTGSWVTSPIPVPSPEEFLWTKTTITYTDGSTSISYTVSMAGATGLDGEPGRGISSTEVTYQLHTGGVTPPTGTWVSTPPTSLPGQFLWTKTTITYTDATTSTSYSVGKIGESSVVAVVSNDNHTLPVAEDGTINYTGSGSTIRLFEGATELVYDGIGTAAGTWKVVSVITTGTATNPAITDSGTYATVAALSGMTTDTVTITYTITGKKRNGTDSINFTTVRSFSKAKAGASAVTPSLWTVDGTVFKNANASDNITLTMDLYKAGAVLTTGVTYQWYKGPAAEIISGATSKTYSVVASSVDSLEVYKCIATYNGTGYSDTITIIDITDPYQVEIISSNGNIFKNATGTTDITAVVRQNGVIVDPLGTTLQYAWLKVDKDGLAEEVVGKSGTALTDITLTQSSAGSTATITGTNASFVPGKFYVFGSEIKARGIVLIEGATVTFDEPTSVALGNTLAIYPVTSSNTIAGIDASDIDEKATYFVDVLA